MVVTNLENIDISNVELVDVNKDNISDYPPRCFLNPKHLAYLTKKNWLMKRFSEGMKIKQLYLEKKLVGFIEYVPGENAWRAVDAKDYLFIHCIWISPNKLKEKGLGSRLVNEVIKDAEKAGKMGVAVVTSKGSFMADKFLFLKNGFKLVSSAKPSYDLLVKKLKEGPNPKFRDSEKQLSEYEGLHIVYSNQCPWVSRFIGEVGSVVKKEGLKLKVTKMKNAKDAQNAPSVYGSFNLIYNGKLLSDHYISITRFKNIIKKEIK